MAYVRLDGPSDGPSLFGPMLGCGPSCACARCGGSRLGERYISVEDDDEDEPPAERPDADSAKETDGYGETPCPAPAGTTRERCKTEQVCPAIPDLVCIRSIGGVAIEYVLSTLTDRATGRIVVGKRSPSGVRARASVGAALERFIRLMATFGMPIEGILSLGGQYCRCIHNTNALSDHSLGEAIDVAGVRWQAGTASGRPPEVLVHNFQLPSDAPWLRRINACLRLAFPLVLDFHFNVDHRDHFHCDMNHGHGRNLGRATFLFAADALSAVLGRPIATPGSWDDLMPALVQFAGSRPPGPRDPWLQQVLDTLFTAVASGGARTAPVPGPVAPAPGATPPSAPAGSGTEEAMVREAMSRGVSSVSDLANLVFNRRHPERRGRSIARDDRAAAQEWLAIRDRIVRPALARSAAPPR
jgi:extensin-like protein